MDSVFARLKTLPYRATTTNCNEYAKQLLKMAGCTAVPCVNVVWSTPFEPWDSARPRKFDTGPLGLVGWQGQDYGGPEYDNWGDERLQWPPE